MSSSANAPGPAQVFVGIPAYDGQITEGIAAALLQATARGHVAQFQIKSVSYLTRNFNMLYASALNGRKQGVTHFLMLHADIAPHGPAWIDRMVDLMEANQADMLSVVVPIKSPAGFTSTALDEPVGNADPRFRVRRLTMKEVFRDYPPTFTHPKLLLNTGLMLIDLRKPWAEKVWFEFDDVIVKNEQGEFKARGMSEDWLFSRKVRKEAPNARLFATREVLVQHIGQARFGNDRPWGAVETDDGARDRDD